MQKKFQLNFFLIDNKMKNKLIGNKSCNNNCRNKFVIALIIFLLCINKPVCSGENNESLESEVLQKNNFVEKCEQRCKDQVNNQSFAHN